jgi:hypothetical protein
MWTYDGYSNEREKGGGEMTRVSQFVFFNSILQTEEAKNEARGLSHALSVNEKLQSMFRSGNLMGRKY